MAARAFQGLLGLSVTVVTVLVPLEQMVLGMGQSARAEEVERGESRVTTHRAFIIPTVQEQTVGEARITRPISQYMPQEGLRKTYILGLSSVLSRVVPVEVGQLHLIA